jgi:RND family efflux transporter MFP subunit
MAQANDALERYGMLHDNGSLPEVQWVEVQSKVAQAKSQLDIAKKNLADCRLVAPVSGIIGKKLVGTGETALPSQAVVTILDVNTVKVKVAVPETEISSITSSTPSQIYVEAAQKTVIGGKIEKGVQADALTHTYDVRIHVRNADHKLLPGMVASVQFAAGSPYVAQQAMLPVMAVQKSSDGSLFVWTIANDSTAHRTKVSIGNTTGNQVTVLGGLDMGQRVVTDGFQKLSEGTKVIY